MDIEVEQLKKVLPLSLMVQGLSRESATSLAGPCRWCGGKDRFVYREDSGKYHCRQCGSKGDILDFYINSGEGSIPELKNKYLFCTTAGAQAECSTLFPCPAENENPTPTPDLAERWGQIFTFQYKLEHVLKQLYSLFVDRRKIGADTISKAVSSGYLFLCNHRGKPSAACKYMDLDGNITAIQYLTLDESPFEGAEDKRVFHPGSQPKKGFFFAGECLERADKIVIVESVVNALSIADQVTGVCCIAIGSTMFTDKLNDLIPFLEMKPLICCLDNDQAGRKAALKVAQNIQGALSIRWPDELGNTKIEKGIDVNDLLKKNLGAVVIELINGAAPLTVEAVEEISAEALEDIVNTDKTGKKKKAKEEIPDLEAARLVYKSYGDGNIIFDGSFCWAWAGDRGVWVKTNDRAIKQKIHESTSSKTLTKNKVNSILDLFKTEIFIPEFNFPFIQNFINCLNGELHFENGQYTIKNHEKENYCITQIPVEYDPQAICERFDRFLVEVFQGDPDAEEKAFLVYQMIGYCLLSFCRFEKFFILIGPGANGKSVLMDVIKELVGRENTASVQPSQFENKFQRAHLHGKLLNLVTEIAEGAQIADAQLKAIVSGELTTAEHKHLPPFEFEPYATCVFGTNHMPHTRDFSEALFRRAIIIRFNRTFEEHEQDRHLKEKLKTELPGILNRSLHALSDVFSFGTFFEPGSTKDAKKEWRLEADQIAQFVDECCFVSPGAGSITSARIYGAYQKWADEVGINKKLNRKNFTIRLKKLGVSPTMGTGGERLISGIALLGSYAVG